MTVALARPEATLELPLHRVRGLGLYDRDAGAWCACPFSSACATRRRVSTPAGIFPVIAARRSGATTSSYGARRRSSSNTTSSSARASTRISPRRRFGAPSKSTTFPARQSMACSASGTARDRASTDRPTRCATPISPAPRPRAARSRSPATTTARNLRPQSISPTRCSSPSACRSSIRPTPRSCLILACTASPCRGFPAVGSA